MQQHLIEQYQKHKNTLIGNKEPWLIDLREEALAYFLDQGLPTTRQENYKYTNLNKLAKSAYQLSQTNNGIAQDMIDSLAINNHNTLLVFVNGHYSAVHSRINEEQDNLYIGSLATALKEKNKLVANYLGKQVSLENSITALNTVLHQDGMVISIGKNVDVKNPIELLFLHHQDDQSMQHVRNLIIADENSRASIIEHHYALNDIEYLKTIVTEIDCCANSHLHYYKIQKEADKATQLSQIDVHQHRDSCFKYMGLDVGGKLIRNDINVKLLSSNASCYLNGLYIAKNKQHIDNHTLIEHQSPHSMSNENFKGIIDNKARAVFNGSVIVHEGAIKTDAKQSNANLLLSNDAEIDTKPQLEIYNDDVKCAHGATVGQLDDDALFYLRSRGVSDKDAKALLTFGFAKSLVDTIPEAPIRHRLIQLVLDKLDANQSIKEFLS